MSVFQTHVEHVEIYNNNFHVILVMHLFTCRNGQKTTKTIQTDALLLFEVGQILIQTINQRKPLFKQLI